MNVVSAPWPVPARAFLEPWQRDLVLRFTSKVWVPNLVTHPDACWLWQACTNTTGYGQCHWPDPAWPATKSNSGRSTSANRAAYILFVADLEEDELACHRCDNRLCVRPSHLFRGDQSVNMRDMVAKGRAWYQRRAA